MQKLLKLPQGKINKEKNKIELTLSAMKRQKKNEI